MPENEVKATCRCSVSRLKRPHAFSDSRPHDTVRKWMAIQRFLSILVRYSMNLLMDGLLSASDTGRWRQIQCVVLMLNRLNALECTDGRRSAPTDGGTYTMYLLRRTANLTLNPKYIFNSLMQTIHLQINSRSTLYGF